MSHEKDTAHHVHHASPHPCRVCSSSVDHDHASPRLGICHHCVYKILILILVVMVSISYIAWFGVL